MNEFRLYTREDLETMDDEDWPIVRLILHDEAKRLGLAALAITIRGFLELQRMVIVARAEEGTNIACQKWIESLPLDNCLATIREKMSTTTTK